MNAMYVNENVRRESMKNTNVWVESNNKDNDKALASFMYPIHNEIHNVQDGIFIEIEKQGDFYLLDCHYIVPDSKRWQHRYIKQFKDFNEAKKVSQEWLKGAFKLHKFRTEAIAI